MRVRITDGVLELEGSGLGLELGHYITVLDYRIGALTVDLNQGL